MSNILLLPSGEIIEASNDGVNFLVSRDTHLEYIGEKNRFKLDMDLIDIDYSKKYGMWVVPDENLKMLKKLLKCE